MFPSSGSWYKIRALNLSFGWKRVFAQANKVLYTSHSTNSWQSAAIVVKHLLQIKKILMKVMLNALFVNHITQNALYVLLVLYVSSVLGLLKDKQKVNNVNSIKVL